MEFHLRLLSGDVRSCVNSLLPIAQTDPGIAAKRDDALSQNDKLDKMRGGQGVLARAKILHL